MSTSEGQSGAFLRRLRGPTELLVDPDRVPPQGLEELFALPAILADLRGAESRARGRPTVWRWAPGWYPRTLVVRQFAHGGLLGGLWGTVFPSSRPMRRELRITRHARQNGLLTCRPVALRLQRVFGPLLRAHYVTEEIPDAPNLLEFCRAERPIPPARRQQIARGAAQTLARMHSIGIDHGDLNLKNLLVLRGRRPPAVAVIDFKKARRRQSVALEDGLRNLVRLDRSVLKWPDSRGEISLSDRLRTLRQYVRMRTGAPGRWKQIARTICTHHRCHAASRK